MGSSKTIAHITDLHLEEEFPKGQGVDAKANWNVILEDVASREIDEIVFGGDIGDASAYPWFFSTLREKRENLDIVLGNHDAFELVDQHWPLASTSDMLYYTFYDQHFQYYFLDTAAERIDDHQLEWISQVRKRQLPIMMFVHHPILPVPTPIDAKHPLLGRGKLEQLLSRQEQPVTIFCGHYHMEDERSSGSIKQFVSPASSYQVEKDAPEIQTHGDWFGYRLIHVEEDTISTEVVRFQNPLG